MFIIENLGNIEKDKKWNTNINNLTIHEKPVSTVCYISFQIFVSIKQ